jgi:tetratricopeptide (TPR) repeat protein
MNIKKHLLYISFCACIFPVSAQTHKIDSLKNVLKTEKEDTNKVQTLNSLADKLRRISKYDSSMLIAGQALDLATKLEFESGIGSAHNTIGNYYSYQGIFSKALSNYQEGLDAFQKVENKIGISFCCNGMGNIYNEEGSYPKALEYYYKALEASEDAKDNVDAAITICNIANIYCYQQNYAKALELYYKALGLSMKIANKEQEART